MELVPLMAFSGLPPILSFRCPSVWFPPVIHPHEISAVETEV
jgi:hypothetical protein